MFWQYCSDTDKHQCCNNADANRMRQTHLIAQNVFLHFIVMWSLMFWPKNNKKLGIVWSYCNMCLKNWLTLIFRFTYSWKYTEMKFGLDQKLCILLAGWQQRHQDHKNWVVRYWSGYLSGVNCKWFAYGPADATATPWSPAPVKYRMVYLSGAGLPDDCPEKRPLNGCSSSSSSLVDMDIRILCTKFYHNYYHHLARPLGRHVQ